MINYIKFRNSAFEEYTKAWLRLPKCLPLEKLEERFFRYIKLNFWLSRFLPYFLYNKWRLKWWRQTLTEVMVFFPLYEIEEEEACSLLVKKNKLYGCNVLRTVGTLGIAVRSMDKIHRVINIRKDKDNLTRLRTNPVYQNESCKDTILDLGNYCILAILLCSGELEDGNE
ncbi:hypothetical protein KAR91_72470 [Candidatus Pacearchaeota archaeon]|nr:hypothetical protein [Candidatus Pacearchaeota archaeon]